MLPLGYFPQLPVVVARNDIQCGATMGGNLPGVMVHPFKVPVGNAPIEYVEDEQCFPSLDAAKAWELRKGYVRYWSYLGEHSPEAKAFKASWSTPTITKVGPTVTV